MKKQDRMKEQIRIHGENLNRIFNLNEDPDKLSRRVHRLEVKAHRLATDYCNGAIQGDDFNDAAHKVYRSLEKIINYKQQRIPVFINQDARGYALKIQDDYVREHDLKIHRDWGGYGILAPEFDGSN